MILPKPIAHSQSSSSLGAPSYQPTTSNFESHYMLPALNNAQIVTDSSVGTSNSRYASVDHPTGAMTKSFDGMMSLHSSVTLEPCQQSTGDSQIPDLEHLNDLPMEISSSLPHTHLTGLSIHYIIKYNDF